MDQTKPRETLVSLLVALKPLPQSGRLPPANDGRPHTRTSPTSHILYYIASNPLHFGLSLGFVIAGVSSTTGAVVDHSISTPISLSTTLIHGFNLDLFPVASHHLISPVGQQ